MSALMKRTIILAGSRLLALSMPLIDYIVVGYFNNTEIALHALATQFIQIAIVIVVTSAVGINFIAGRDNTDRELVSSCAFGYVFYMGVCAALIFLLTGCFSHSGWRLAIIAVLALGIPFSAGYVASSAILETNGYERKILKISLISAVLNLLIDVLLVSLLAHPAMLVAIGTTLIRSVQFVMSFFLVKTLMGFYLRPVVSKSITAELFRLSLSDTITSVFFITSIYLALSFISRHFADGAVASIGIALNQMNIIAVICVSFCISYIIQTTKKERLKIRLEAHSIKLAVIFFSTLSLILVVVNPLISRLYNLSASIDNLTTYMLMAIIIVILDGIAIFINSHLRCCGFKIIPPLFRLSLVFIGIPLGCFLSLVMKKADYLLLGMVVGNLLSLILSGVFYAIKATAAGEHKVSQPAE